MKRFWKTAQAEPADGGWAIALDGRPVRTPSRALLAVPNEALAHAITAEWDAQGEELDPTTMPMTGFANATIDRVLPALGEFRGRVAVYAESDLLCYRADGPAELVERQSAQWGPLLDWARTQLGVDFAITSGVLPVDQPARTLAGLRGAVEALDPWQLSGVATLTQISGSLVGTLAMLHGAITDEALFDTANLDERWQAERWGEDAEAADRLGLRRAEFLAAARWCALASEG